MNDFDLPRSVVENLIDEWIFDEKYRYILKRKLFDNISFESLSEEVNMSTRQVKNIVYQCKNILFEHL